MTEDSTASSRWRPRGFGGWILAFTGLAFANLALLIAYGMLTAAQWFSLAGTMGALSLMFPLLLLIVAALAFGIWLLARLRRARLASLTAGFAALLTTGLGLWPALAQWQMARSAGVPVSLAAYWTDSLKIFEKVKAARTERYGTASDGTQLLLDVWPADPVSGPRPHPALVMVHGGGWTGGVRSEMWIWDRWANALGYHVFDVTYRMPPPERWREEVGDVKCALGWVKTNAARLGVDPARISLMGSSAGGNLALLAAYSMGDPALPPSCPVEPVAVRSVVNLYGPVDLIRLRENSAARDYIAKITNAYIGGPPSQFPDRYRMVSPIFHVSPSSPPTISFIGLRDRLVPYDQHQSLDAALEKSGVRHESWFLPAADHVFDANRGLFATQFAMAKAEAFLRANN